MSIQALRTCLEKYFSEVKYSEEHIIKDFPQLNMGHVRSIIAVFWLDPEGFFLSMSEALEKLSLASNDDLAVIVAKVVLGVSS